MRLDEFVAARIVERERAARSAPSDPLGVIKFGALADAHGAKENGDSEAGALLWMAERIKDRVDDLRPRTLHAPARVLAECEAQWRIVEYVTGRHTGSPEGYEILRLLALPFAGHPDYREEWKP